MKTLTAIVLAGLVLAGCGDSDDDDASDGATSSAPTTDGGGTETESTPPETGTEEPDAPLVSLGTCEVLGAYTDSSVSTIYEGTNDSGDLVHARFDLELLGEDGAVLGSTFAFVDYWAAGVDVQQWQAAVITDEAGVEAVDDCRVAAVTDNSEATEELEASGAECSVVDDETRGEDHASRVDVTYEMAGVEGYPYDRDTEVVVVVYDENGTRVGSTNDTVKAGETTPEFGILSPGIPTDVPPVTDCEVASVREPL